VFTIIRTVIYQTVAHLSQTLWVQCISYNSQEILCDEFWYSVTCQSIWQNMAKHGKTWQNKEKHGQIPSHALKGSGYTLKIS